MTLTGHTLAVVSLLPGQVRPIAAGTWLMCVSWPRPDARHGARCCQGCRFDGETKEPDGRVTLIRLRREDRRPRLVKPVVRKGLLVLPLDNGELDSEALDREIREERERENARLLVWHSLAERTSRPVCAGTPGRRTAFNAVTRQWP